MRLWSFSVRTTKEILRDKLNLAFGLGFPTVLLLLLSAIEANIPAELFAIEQLAPGIAVFGLSFMTLFSATLVAKDRESALLARLYTTPLRASEFIVGYLLPQLPIALAQSVVCYAVALLLGLPWSGRIVTAIACIVPISLFYIGMGLLCGSVFNVKQVGGICGAVLTNVGAWLSGTWFDLELVGGAFQKIAYLLPFAHAVQLQRGIVAGTTAQLGVHFVWVLGYGLAAIGAATALFLRQMRK